MVKTCFTDFADAVRDYMDPDDADALLEDVKERAEARLRKSPHILKRAEAYNKSVEEVIAEREENLKQSQLDSIQNIKKSVANRAFLKQFPNQAKGTWAMLGGRQSNIAKSRSSYVNNLLVEILQRKSQFYSDLERMPGALEYFRDNKNSDTIVKEMEFKGTSKNPFAEHIADTWKAKNLPWLTKDLKEQGARIFEDDDYIARQIHNAGRMLSATGSELKDYALKSKLMLEHKGNWPKIDKIMNEMAYQRWFNIVRPLVDEDRTLKNVLPEGEDKFFRSFYKATTTGIHKVPYDEVGHPMITRMGTNYARKLEQERILHLKKGSWSEYNRPYGYDNIHNAIVSQIENGSKYLTLMRQFGTSPRVAIERLIKLASEQSRELPGAAKELRRTRALADNILGDQDRVMMGLGGKAIRAFRQLVYMSRLGGVTLSSIPDIPIIASAAKANGISYLKAYEDAFGGLMKGMSRGLMREISLQLRVYSDGTLGSIMGRFGAEDTLPGMMTRGMKLQDKWSLINYWDSVNRETMGFMLSKNLADNMHHSFDSLDEGLQRTLTVSGIDKKSWNLLTKYKHAVLEAEDHKFLTPSIVNEISDEDIARDIIGNKAGKSTPLKLRKARFDFKRSLEIYFQDQTVHGKIIPDISDITLMRGNVQNSSPIGALLNFVTMFKSFRVAALRRVHGRFLYSNGAENLYEALFQKGTRGDLKGLGNYMVQSLPFGYLSTASKAVAAGYSLPDLDNLRTWEELITRSGGASMMGDFFIDMLIGQRDEVQSLLGPGLSTGANAVKILKDIVQGKGHPAEMAVNMGIRNTPGLGIFYVKPFANYAFLNPLREKAYPGYLERKERRALKNNEGFYWALTSGLGVD